MLMFWYDRRIPHLYVYNVSLLLKELIFFFNICTELKILLFDVLIHTMF